MEAIKVYNFNFHQSIKAFKMLFGRMPEITTCNRFDDCENVPVFSSCPIVKVGKTIVDYECDGEVFKAYINKVNYFWFT